MEEPSPLGMQANEALADRRVEAWGAPMMQSISQCAPIAEHEWLK